MHEMSVSASCNRIPTLDGHLENVFADLKTSPNAADVVAAMREYPPIDLPSAPDPLIHVFEDPDRPQPRLDRMNGGGMAVSAGGVRETETGVQYNALAHNTVRGAAGASILNGELLVRDGWL
jgi:aspartate-semialdehyde dehydrogenase